MLVYLESGHLNDFALYRPHRPGAKRPFLHMSTSASPTQIHAVICMYKNMMNGRLVVPERNSVDVR